MTDFTAREIFILFGGGGVLLGIFIWLGVTLHLAYTKGEMMLDHFKNSSAIMALAPLKHGGPWGHLLLAGGICGAIAFPRFNLQNGRLSAEDLSNFPVSLKRRLIMLQWIGVVLVSLLFLLWGIGEIVGWL